MIVNCPSCSSRYRIRDEKIKGRGARITCPNCSHKFVVHRDDQPMVVGDDARGVPVTFARGGMQMRHDFDEDDEADVPTTVMPHGSQLAQSIRAAAARANEAPIVAGGGVSVATAAAPVTVQAAMSSPVSAPASAAADPTRQLRAQAAPAAAAQAEASGSSRSIGLALLLVVMVVVMVAALASTGIVDVAGVLPL